MMKQKKTIDYVLTPNRNSDDLQWRMETIAYARKFSQSPQLGHFIVCDENNKPLEEPKVVGVGQSMQSHISKQKAYQKAKERLIYKRFERLDWKEGWELIGGQNKIRLSFTDGRCLNYETGKEITSLEDLSEYQLELQ